MSGGKVRSLVPSELQGIRQQFIDVLPQLMGAQLGALGVQGGPFGTQTALQRGQPNPLAQMFTQQTPEARALETTMPALQEMLTGTGPQFERDISMANLQGGRFGSANAILRGEAMRNLFNQRTQTAQTMGMLAQGAGQADVQRQQLFQSILGNLLGTSMGAAFGAPTQQSQGLGGTLGGIGGMLAGSFLGPLGASAGGALGSKLFGGK